MYHTVKALSRKEEAIYKVKVSQFGPLGRLGEDKNRARTLIITTELPFIPQIGSYFKFWPYANGKVEQVFHEYDSVQSSGSHEVRLEDTHSHSNAVKWDRLPNHVKALGLMVRDSDGNWCRPANVFDD